jgi:hypothetical protein
MAPPVAEQDGDLTGAEGVLGTEHDRDGETAEAVGGQHPDGVGAALGEVAAKHVEVEAQFLGGTHNPSPGLRLELAASIECLGDGAGGDVGEGGHVVDRGAAAMLSRHCGNPFGN